MWGLATIMDDLKKLTKKNMKGITWPEVLVALMIVIVIISLITFGSFRAEASTLNWSICKQNVKRINCVVDGDTYWKEGIKYRIMGLDTPEKKPRAKCGFEHSLSNKATRFLFEQFRGSNVTEVERGKDRYGRVLADTYVNGKLIAPIIIRNGLGVEYNAKKRREGIWCN